MRLLIAEDEHTGPSANTVRVTLVKPRRGLGDPPGAGYQVR